MTNEKHIRNFIEGNLLYFNMLGSLTGFHDNNERGVRWISGKINYTYHIETSDAADIIRRINDNALPHRIYIGIDNDGSRAKPFIDTGHFKSEVDGLAMGHALMDTSMWNLDKTVVKPVCDEPLLKAVRAIHLCDCDLFTLQNYKEIMERPETYFYIAEYDGVPASFCMAQYGDDFMQISWVVTLPEYRKRGLGGYLIQTAEREAAKHGKRYAVLCAINHDVSGTYKRVGYKEVSQAIKLNYKPT